MNSQEPKVIEGWPTSPAAAADLDGGGSQASPRNPAQGTARQSGGFEPGGLDQIQ